MKGYLFGLGAMLVGAGLMFVLMHGEVSADNKVELPEKLVCTQGADAWIEGKLSFSASKKLALWHCRVDNLNCVLNRQGVSCVKRGFF